MTLDHFPNLSISVSFPLSRKNRGWRGSSVVKSLQCSYRWLSSVPGTHLGGLQPYPTPVPEDRKPLASKGTSTHVHIPTYIHMIKNNKNRS